MYSVWTSSLLRLRKVRLILTSSIQAFRKLSKGLAALADTASNFDSTMISGLLRSAPDLTKHIQNVESMYQKPEKGSYYGQSFFHGRF